MRNYLNILSVTLFSLLLSACGSGGSAKSDGGAVEAPQYAGAYETTFTPNRIVGNNCNIGAGWTQSVELTQSDSTLAFPWVHGVGDVDSPTIQITGAVQGDGSFEMTGSGATGSNLFTMTFDGTVGGGRWSGEYTLGWQKGSIQCQYIYLFEGVSI